MTLGNRLRTERKSLGFSQAQLAAHAGIRTNAQGHYECGFRTPRADYLECLSAIGMDVHFILFGIRKPAPVWPLTEDESLMINSLRQLEETDRQAIERIMIALSRASADPSIDLN